mmetsp:Transcript_10273/g.8825  ORF Transcript_10273/g.8825 Transcript_10273/m.8825 type:complete len:696 (-) Transcript_10273:337-2424(-)
MMEDTLGESLTGSQRSQVSSETERFSDGEIRLDLVEGSTLDGLFFSDDTSSLVKTLIDTTHSLEGSSNFSQEVGFLESGFSAQFGGIVDSSGSGNHLTTTSVDSISMEGNINNVDSDGSHVFFTENSFLGGPLESRVHGVSDFVHELNSLGDIDEDVTTTIFGTEAPDSEGFFLIPFEFISQSLGSGLNIILGSDITLFDEISNTFGEGLGLAVKSVMLVGRLGQADLTGFSGDGFLVGNDGVRLLNGAVGVFFLQILQANFDVEFTTTGNNMLTGFFVDNEDEGIRLGELIQTIDELGKILSVLGLDGDSDDWGDGVLHNSDVVGFFVIGEGTGLQEILIDTDHTDSVTTGDIGDGFDGSTHHEDSSLDGLNGQIILLSGFVVGTHNSDLLTAIDGTGEDSTESEETSLIGGWHHLGDVEHQRTLGVTFSDTFSAGIVLGTFVKIGDSVLLSGLGGGEMEHHHFKQSISSIDPLGEDELQKLLALQFSLSRLKFEVDGLDDLVELFHVTIHNRSGDLDDGVHTELDESSLKSATIITDGLDFPLLTLGIEEVVTPKLLHKLGFFNLELVSIHLGESGQSETPAFLSGTEGNISLFGEEQKISHIGLLVVGDDNVDEIDDSDEVLIHTFTISLEFENGSINLVDHENGSDLFTHSLSKDSLGLDTNTFDTIDDDESTIGDSESSGNFRREINVPG